MGFRVLDRVLHVDQRLECTSHQSTIHSGPAMNRSSSRYAASLFTLSLLTFGSASQAGTLTSVAPSNTVGASAYEAIGVLASRVLEPSLRSAGGGITDATAPVPGTVPEPGSIALLGLGLATMFVAKRRSARQNR